MTPYLTVVIPAYNEEERIAKTLDEINTYLNKRSYTKEIIVVDDGSKDRTRDLVTEKQETLKNLKLIKNPHRGKGYTVKTGMLASRGENVLFTDADNATPIKEIEKLLKALEEGADIAIGSRSLSDSELEKDRPWVRRLGAKLGNFLIQFLLLPGINDTQTGFKLFAKKTIQPIFAQQKMDGFSFDIEILYVAKKLNYKIAEVPIRWRHQGSSKLRSSDFLKVLFDLFRIKFWYWQKMNDSRYY